MLLGTGGRSQSHTATSVTDKLCVDKSNNKQLIQSTLYDQQTPYTGWKLYFPDQCRFAAIFVNNHSAIFTVNWFIS